MFAKPLALIALVAALGAAACRAAPEPDRSADRPALGLMTTLPLVWAEAVDVGELLAARGEGSWVRQEFERRFALAPLDTLDAASIAELDRIVLAQPRPLTPAENVALDAWVRRGGRLLLFADPMLTHHSRYPVGDRRRPQDVVLLSPILAHWGLELHFDDDQRADEWLAAVGEVPVPVHLAGTLKPTPAARCAIEADGMLARCAIGEGRVTIFADAAVLDDTNADIGRTALETLLEAAFEDSARFQLRSGDSVLGISRERRLSMLRHHAKNASSYCEGVAAKSPLNWGVCG